MEAPRSYLFTTWEGGGNVPPVFGLVRRLAGRGHRVRVLTEPCLREVTRSCGASFVPFTRHFTRTDRTVDVIEDWKHRSPLKNLRTSLDRILFGPAPDVAADARRALEAEPADVVVADLMMVGALMAAEAAGIPRVVLFHMPEYLPGPGRPAAGPGFLPAKGLPGRIRDALFERLFFRILNDYTPALNTLRDELGLPPLGTPLDLYHDADLRLIQTTKAFDFPITPSPPNVRYVGPVLDDPDWAAPWQSPWPDDDARPLIVVSLSSTFQNQHAVVQRALDALGGLPDVRGLVTLGPAMANDAFDVPGNTLTIASAPHGQVFPRASAVVTHAGHGTVMRALAHDLPLVCLPMGRDQDDNAARVVARGAGLRLGPGASAGKLRRALRRVLGEPAFRAHAAQLGRLIREDAAEDRAVGELETLGRPAHALPV